MIIILGILAIWVSKRNNRPVDYYNLFIIGMIWTAVGIPLKNPFMFPLGLIFMVVGLVNRKKWKANRKSWKDLGKSERKIVWIVTLLLGFLVAIGFVLFILIARGVI